MNDYNNQYKTISKFGSMAPSAVNNPITYCINNTIDSNFLHGSDALNYGGQYCGQCQWFLSDYCAQGWDSYCELASHNIQTRFPNQMICHDPLNISANLTAGEILIRNTASRKYLVKMISGKQKFEPFDPRVSDSPMISKWVPDDNCYSPMRPIYAVNPTQIDDDIVMNKILMKPIIALDILINIYQTMKRQGTLNKLNNTRLGNFYGINKQYFK